MAMVATGTGHGGQGTASAMVATGIGMGPGPAMVGIGKDWDRGPGTGDRGPMAHGGHWHHASSLAASATVAIPSRSTINQKAATGRNR